MSRLNLESFRDSTIKKHQQADLIGLLKNINKFTRLASLAH